jgi:hypothetical protein
MKRRKLSPYTEALTRAEAIALQDELDRPITWEPQHHHSGDGVLRQKDTDSDGTNQVAPRVTP